MDGDMNINNLKKEIFVVTNTVHSWGYITDMNKFVIAYTMGVATREVINIVLATSPYSWVTKALSCTGASVVELAITKGADTTLVDLASTTFNKCSYAFGGAYLGSLASTFIEPISAKFNNDILGQESNIDNALELGFQLDLLMSLDIESLFS